MGRRWKALAACAALLGLAVSLAGCSRADSVKAAGMIHAYLPTVMALAQDAAAIAGALDPAAAATVQAVNTKVQADLETVETVSGAYAAAPTTNGWASLGAAVDALVSDADQGLLTALAIKNSESQARAKAALSAVDAAVHVLDGYLLAARTPAEVQAAAAQRAVKLQSVARYWDQQAWRRVEAEFVRPGKELAEWETAQGL